MSKIPGLTINHSNYPLPNGQQGKIAVFLYTGKSDPKYILDSAVSQYVKNHPYHELIDSHLDNPWMRVVISDINGMVQEEFDPARHNIAD